MNCQPALTPVSSMQPPVVHQGNDVTLNLTLTIPESILVAFAKNMIRYHLDQGNKLIYLGATENLQQHFTKFVAQKFSDANLSPEQQRLSALIESLWSKTKATIDNILRVEANQTNIQTEARLHEQATDELATLRAQG